MYTLLAELFKRLRERDKGLVWCPTPAVNSPSGEVPQKVENIENIKTGITKWATTVLKVSLVKRYQSHGCAFSPDCLYTSNYTHFIDFKLMLVPIKNAG